MSLKFEISDWKFELNWKELHCEPIERGAKEKEAARRRLQASHGKDAGASARLRLQTINSSRRREGLIK